MATKLLRLRTQLTQSYTTSSSLVKTKLNTIQSRINNFEIPERFKGTVVEKWLQYWKGLVTDYRDVFLGVIQQLKEKPIRAAIYGGLGGAAVYTFKHNPNEVDFIQQLREYNVRMVMIDPVCQNPISSQYLIFVERCYNEGIVRKLNLGIFSLLWLDNYNRALGLYKTTCSFTQPELLTWHQRIIDVGFLDKWWIIEKKMIDFDINEDNL
ncbi:mitochondrial import inner membrane translocase subunit Tim29 [Sitodiplosis mosellana]|uniref:mitochondrial import inner membrane translocase subunit Tim29 n=1 Tax=Sitodiplosis mosellana TaxID=263140 RepID=UPI002443C85A|nr:mitochondrial import inner membrane translocase subunit Tim29 [Sitodiplosis mosellana]